MLWYISDATISSRFIWFQVVNSVSTMNITHIRVGIFHIRISIPTDRHKQPLRLFMEAMLGRTEVAFLKATASFSW
ncbi:hypothetical protein EOM57_01705 [Candidatus Saccharibacteria bacterium]|nr:hypothetical protein [Candidatus Saccharibacteria bacterium]